MRVCVCVCRVVFVCVCVCARVRMCARVSVCVFELLKSMMQIIYMYMHACTSLEL